MLPDRPVRRAGARWRILVHEWLGAKSGTGLPYGRSWDVSSNPRNRQRGEETARAMRERKPDAQPQHDWASYITLEGTEFDELVVGSWIHLEQMDTGTWWMNVGGVTVNIRVDRDGRPRVVDVYGPGDYGVSFPGCRYSITWSGEEEALGGEERSDEEDE